MWTVRFNQDTDKKGEGTVVASYTDPDTNFQLEERIDTDVPNAIQDFITKAKEGLVAKQKETSDMDMIAKKIESVLNQ